MEWHWKARGLESRQRCEGTPARDDHKKIMRQRRVGQRRVLRASPSEVAVADETLVRARSGPLEDGLGELLGVLGRDNLALAVGAADARLNLA